MDSDENENRPTHPNDTSSSGIGGLKEKQGKYPQDGGPKNIPEHLKDKVHQRPTSSEEDTSERPEEERITRKRLGEDLGIGEPQAYEKSDHPDARHGETAQQTHERHEAEKMKRAAGDLMDSLRRTPRETRQ